MHAPRLGREERKVTRMRAEGNRMSLRLHPLADLPGQAGSQRRGGRRSTCYLPDVVDRRARTARSKFDKPGVGA